MDVNALPKEQEEQMELGLKIIATGFRNKMQLLEQDLNIMRTSTEEVTSNCALLQKRQTSLEHDLVDSSHRCQQLAQENQELHKTFATMKKQIGKLEALKAAVSTHIQEDQEDEVGIGLPLASSPWIRDLATGSLGTSPRGDSVLSAPISPVYPQSPQYPLASLAAPTGPGVAGASTFAATSGNNWAHSGVNKDTPVHSGIIDGKEFFRQARMALSYESFNAFLQTIKRLNNNEQTREDTLEESRRIFGMEHAHLYRDFESILTRNLL